jgi:uncharacterized hydrophobic protein (TIGR00271 family)
VLELRVYGGSQQLIELGADLEQTGAAWHTALTPATTAGRGLLTAEVERRSADAALEFVLAAGVPQDDVAIVRLDDVGPVSPVRRTTTLIWADVMGQAGRNARPVARYLAFMMVAGVIAGFGVIEENSTLIVGAMAVSPDMLPVTAVCAAVLERRWRLAGLALSTLAIGLGASCLMAAAVTGALDLFGGLPSNFEVGEGPLAGILDINSATIGVALAAGVAGMLALETRASSAVGVAISVTTIPAAAYLGVAAAVGEVDKAWGALAVLAVNVAMLLVGGTATLVIQRWIARRPERRLPRGRWRGRPPAEAETRQASPPAARAPR